MGIGTRDNPFSFAEALACKQIQGGNTIHLLPGTYRGIYSLIWRGLSEAPIVIRGYEKAVIDGGFDIPAVAGHMQINGVILTDSSNLDRVSALPDPAPVDISRTASMVSVQAAGVDLINCHITNGWSGAFTGQDAGGELYGCLIYHNGFWSPQNNYGHNVYCVNGTGDYKRIVDCIMFDSYGYNIHAYSSSHPLDYFWIEGNILFNAGAYYRGNAKNLHIGGEVERVISPVILDNMTYAGANRLRYDGPVTGAILRNNYFANPGGVVMELDHSAIAEMSSNTFIGEVVGFDPADWPTNVYISDPTGIDVFVRSNQHAAGRLHVAVYNWDDAETVRVDVSAHYADGTAVKARNVQDYFKDVQTATVAAGMIELDMRAAGHSVSMPVGADAPCASTFPRFGCFVIEPV